MTVLASILKNQKKHQTTPVALKPGAKIGFIFSTKDRVDLSLQSLPTIDAERGFDIIWVDGSVTKEGRDLPQQYQFKNARFVEYHLDVRGGPDKAIQFGLKRLLELGYDYCGLIENDIVFEKGWFDSLMELFSLASRDGVAVGAVSVRNYESRVLEYRNRYTLNWNIGAGMILFSQPGAQLVVDNYAQLYNFGRKLCYFYGKLLGVDLRRNSEPARYWLGKPISADFSYDMILYKHGLASVASLPSLVNDLGFDLKERELIPVGEERNNAGVLSPRISFVSLQWLLVNTYLLGFLWNIWKIVISIPIGSSIGRAGEKKLRNTLRIKRGLKSLS